MIWSEKAGGIYSGYQNSWMRDKSSVNKFQRDGRAQIKVMARLRNSGNHGRHGFVFFEPRENSVFHGFSQLWYFFWKTFCRNYENLLGFLKVWKQRAWISQQKKRSRSTARSTTLSSPAIKVSSYQYLRLSLSSLFWRVRAWCRKIYRLRCVYSEPDWFFWMGKVQKF